MSSIGSGGNEHTTVHIIIVVGIDIRNQSSENKSTYHTSGKKKHHQIPGMICPVTA